MAYAIKNKETGQFFSGFEKNQPVWSGKPYVWADKLHAQCQASLFLCLGLPVQRKPVEFPNV